MSRYSVIFLIGALFACGCTQVYKDCKTDKDCSGEERCIDYGEVKQCGLPLRECTPGEVRECAAPTRTDSEITICRDSQENEVKQETCGKTGRWSGCGGASAFYCPNGFTLRSMCSKYQKAQRCQADDAECVRCMSRENLVCDACSVEKALAEIKIRNVEYHPFVPLIAGVYEDSAKATESETGKDSETKLTTSCCDPYADYMPAACCYNNWDVSVLPRADKYKDIKSYKVFDGGGVEIDDNVAKYREAVRARCFKEYQPLPESGNGAEDVDTRVAKAMEMLNDCFNGSSKIRSDRCKDYKQKTSKPSNKQYMEFLQGNECNDISGCDKREVLKCLDRGILLEHNRFCSKEIMEKCGRVADGKWRLEMFPELTPEQQMKISTLPPKGDKNIISLNGQKQDRLPSKFNLPGNLLDKEALLKAGYVLDEDSGNLYYKLSEKEQGAFLTSECFDALMSDKNPKPINSCAILTKWSPNFGSTPADKNTTPVKEIELYPGCMKAITEYLETMDKDCAAMQLKCEQNGEGEGDGIDPNLTVSQRWEAIGEGKKVPVVCSWLQGEGGEILCDGDKLQQCSSGLEVASEGGASDSKQKIRINCDVREIKAFDNAGKPIDWGGTCEIGQGICHSRGSWLCSGKGVKCSAKEKQPQTCGEGSKDGEDCKIDWCDGLDNDCDGKVDEVMAESSVKMNYEIKSKPEDKYRPLYGNLVRNFTVSNHSTVSGVKTALGEYTVVVSGNTDKMEDYYDALYGDTSGKNTSHWNQDVDPKSKILKATLLHALHPFFYNQKGGTSLRIYKDGNLVEEVKSDDIRYVKEMNFKWPFGAEVCKKTASGGSKTLDLECIGKKEFGENSFYHTLFHKAVKKDGGESPEYLAYKFAKVRDVLEQPALTYYEKNGEKYLLLTYVKKMPLYYEKRDNESEKLKSPFGTEYKVAKVTDHKAIVAAMNLGVYLDTFSFSWKFFSNLSFPKTSVFIKSDSGEYEQSIKFNAEGELDVNAPLFKMHKWIIDPDSSAKAPELYYGAYGYQNELMLRVYKINESGALAVQQVKAGFKPLNMLSHEEDMVLEDADKEAYLAFMKNELGFAGESLDELNQDSLLNEMCITCEEESQVFAKFMARSALNNLSSLTECSIHDDSLYSQYTPNQANQDLKLYKINSELFQDLLKHKGKRCASGRVAHGNVRSYSAIVIPKDKCVGSEDLSCCESVGVYCDDTFYLDYTRHLPDVVASVGDSIYYVQGYARIALGNGKVTDLNVVRDKIEKDKIARQNASAEELQDNDPKAEFREVKQFDHIPVQVEFKDEAADGKVRYKFKKALGMYLITAENLTGPVISNQYPVVTKRLLSNLLYSIFIRDGRIVFTHFFSQNEKGLTGQAPKSNKEYGSEISILKIENQSENGVDLNEDLKKNLLGKLSEKISGSGSGSAKVGQFNDRLRTLLRVENSPLKDDSGSIVAAALVSSLQFPDDCFSMSFKNVSSSSGTTGDNKEKCNPNDKIVMHDYAYLSGLVFPKSLLLTTVKVGHGKGSGYGTARINTVNRHDDIDIFLLPLPRKAVVGDKEEDLSGEITGLEMEVNGEDSIFIAFTFETNPRIQTVKNADPAKALFFHEYDVQTKETKKKAYFFWAKLDLNAENRLSAENILPGAKQADLQNGYDKPKYFLKKVDWHSVDLGENAQRASLSKIAGSFVVRHSDFNYENENIVRIDRKCDIADNNAM